jgi:hypothetical protein
MTTDEVEQAERPLTEVDEVAERIQSSSRAPESDSFNLEAARQAVQRVSEDPRPVAFLVAGLISVIIVAALAWGRRPQPRSAEDLFLERSRKALDDSREALEAVIAKLGSVIER